MFTGRVLFNDFVFSTLLAGLMLWISIAFPMHIALDFSWSSLFIGLPVVLIFYFHWNFHFHFTLDPSPAVFICQAILGVTMFLILTSHLDLMLTHFGENPIRKDSVDAILNSLYSFTVVVVGGICGYVNAFLKSPSLNIPKNAVASWWTTDLDLNEHAYLSPPGVSRLKPLFIGFGGVALILVAPLLLDAVSTFNPETIKLLILRLAAMGLTLIVYTVLAVSVGEAIRLIQLERQIGKGSFKLYDFDKRLKWRHDYVKYHLPSPIRKLNLRLFNQHVEAYERLQTKVKSSRT